VSGYAIGIDGGGTRTRGVLLGPDGEELGRAEGASAVADALHPEAAAQAVEDVTRAAARAAGVALPLRALWAGLSGAGREAARSAVEIELARRGLADVTRVGTDVLAAFHDAFGDGPGVLLIAGTGSIAWGRSEDGREGRVGGWGRHIGDEGSGYAIGLEALKRVARQADGRAPETALRAAILSRLGLETIDDLVQWAGGASRAEVAALVPLVAGASAAGDAVAGEILVRAVEELEDHVLAILENLGPWERPPGIALAGGLITPGGPLRAPLERVLARHRLVPLGRTPDAALGAARLGRTLGTFGT